MIGDIGDLPAHVHSGIPHPLDLVLDAPLVDVEQRNPRPIDRERFGIAQADTARPAGHDHAEAFNIE